MAIKRILMIGPVDFSIDNAPKVHFYNLAKEFSNLGANVLSIVYGPIDKNLSDSKINFKILSLPNPLKGSHFLRFIKYFNFTLISLWQSFKFSPSIIYLRFSPPSFFYLLFLRLLKIFYNKFKIILELNSWISEERKVLGESEKKIKLVEFMQIKSAFLSDFLRVVSPGIKEKLIKYRINERKIALIGNGTDINHFKPINKKEAKKTLGLDPHFLYVGFIGNFVIWQGLEYLLQTIPKILETNKNVRFILVGDGILMPKIRKEVSRFKEEQVALTGNVPYQKANLYINAFDIGIAPFIKERNENIGLSPLKIRDYAACGVPIITTKIRGLEIVKEKKIGILVPPNDAEALFKAIKKLVNSSRLRKEMGKRGRKLAEEIFSWEYVARQILNINSNTPSKNSYEKRELCFQRSY
ncbi:MAG: glycosyltransferase family 4 protein [candidate division WOR-3 bacterium]